LLLLVALLFLRLGLLLLLALIHPPGGQLHSQVPAAGTQQATTEQAGQGSAVEQG
jgi:hypothetical protein